MSTTSSRETDPDVVAGAPPVQPPVVDAPVAGADRLSPALMIGVFVILLLCVALALVAYQNA